MSNGYVSAEVRARVRAATGNRCGYCQSPQHLVLGWLEIEHLSPTFAGRIRMTNRIYGSRAGCATGTKAINPMDPIP